MQRKQANIAKKKTTKYNLWNFVHHSPRGVFSSGAQERKHQARQHVRAGKKRTNRTKLRHEADHPKTRDRESLLHAVLLACGLGASRAIATLEGAQQSRGNIVAINSGYPSPGCPNDRMTRPQSLGCKPLRIRWKERDQALS